MTEDKRTLDELYAEHARMDGQIAEIRRRQAELWRLISKRDDELEARREAAMAKKGG